MAKKQNSYLGKTPVVSLAMQSHHITRRFPSFHYSRENGGAVWRGTLQPRASSPAYKVVIEYKIGKCPKVRVVWPQLARGAPHRYGDGTLCLYWPDEWGWRHGEIIAETILPWAALWLYYYELWLDTGKWLGPSSPHAQPEKTRVGRDES